MKPAVSIITPIRARHAAHVRWLDETVASVQGQTRDDWEMVIVDDHGKVPLPGYDDARVRMFSLAGNERGVSAARNEAARLARADLLLPLDADDKLALTAVASWLDAWKGSGILYSDVVMFGKDFARAYLSPDYDFNTLLKATFMLVGCLHLKADWQRVGGWRDDMQGGLEDWEYWLALGELGVCGARVPEPLYWYRRQAGGRLARLKADPAKWHRAYNRMRELHIDSYNGRFPVGCCGGGRKVAGVVSRRQPLAKAPVVTGKTVLLIYRGKRAGGFGVRGQPSNIRYTVPGRGDFVVEAESGRPGVDRRDVARFLGFNQGRDFQVVTPPAASKPAPKAAARVVSQPVPQATPATSDAWEPAQAAVLPHESQDPTELSVREIKALILTTHEAAAMLIAEMDGKNRKTVVSYLGKLTHVKDVENLSK